MFRVDHPDTNGRGNDMYYFIALEVSKDALARNTVNMPKFVVLERIISIFNQLINIIISSAKSLCIDISLVGWVSQLVRQHESSDVWVQGMAPIGLGA